MPTVDFTLDEFLAASAKQTESILDQHLGPAIDQRIGSAIERALVKERDYTRSYIDERFKTEREHTRAMISASTDELKLTFAAELKSSIADEFSSFWDNNLAPVLEEMQDDIKVLKHMVKA